MSSPGRARRAGARLVEHPDVAKVAFTGSTAVGARIAAAAAATIKRVTLELGGKSANVVFADADLQAAAAAAPAAVFGNAGQDCCARSRILVERSALDAFMDALEEAVEAVRVGDPLDEATEMGPLISADQRETRRRRSSPDDAPVAIRGTAPDGPGFWFPPTVLCPVERDDRAVREEIFGPVAVVIPFRDEAEAVGAGQRHDLRPVGLDLDARRRQGAARGARGRDRRAVDQRQHVGAGVDAVRRLQAVGLRARAGPARARSLHGGQVGVLRDMSRLEGKVCVITGRRERHRRRDRGALPRGGRDGRRRRPARRHRGRRPRAGRRRRRRGRRPRDVRARARGVRHARRALQQRRHLPHRRRLGARHVARRLAARAGRQHEVGLPVLQARHPAPARRRRRAR